MTHNQPLKLLFVCRHNAIRSQIAAVLANSIGEGKVNAQSAGVELDAIPNFIHEWAQQFSEQTTKLTSTSISEMQDIAFDMIITLCDKTHQILPELDSDSEHICWDFHHPDDIGSLKHLEIELAERLRLMFLAKGIL